MNLNYIDVLEEVNGILEFHQIDIKQNGTEIIDKLNQMLENDNQSVLDMQGHFTREYTPKQDYRMPYANKNKSFYDYCHPHSYKSRYISGAEYPKIFTFNEYNQHIKDKRVQYTEDLNEQYKSKYDDKGLTTKEYKELVANIPHKVDEMINDLKYSLKSSFKKQVVRYIHADNFYRTMQEVRSADSCKMVSTETIGFTTYDYTINSDIEFIVKTNFGYGSASYFYVNLKYKGIDILPYSDYVKYYYANMVDFVRYTRLYDVVRDSWNIAFSFVEEIGNLAILEPTKFVEVWIRNECREMMTGLRRIADNPVKSIKDMIGKFGQKSKDKDNHSICLRNVYQSEVDLYKAYPEEMTIAYKVEKISGALLLLNKLRELVPLYSSITGDIDEIKAMNLDLVPEIESRIQRISKEIRNKHSVLKKEETKLLSLEKKNESWYGRFNPRNYDYAFQAPRIDGFLKNHPKYQKAYDEILSQKAILQGIEEDIKQRNSFLDKLNNGKELIQTML